MKTTTTNNRSQQQRAAKKPPVFPVQVRMAHSEKWNIRGNPKSTHNPDHPIVVLEDDPISLIEQVCELVPPMPTGKKGLIYTDWTTNVHPTELLFKIGKDAESGNTSLNSPVIYSGSPSMQYNGGIFLYHDGTLDDIWHQLAYALHSIAGGGFIVLPDASGFAKFCMIAVMNGWENFLPGESFADLAARLDEEEGRESEGVSQNDLRPIPAPIPPAPHATTG
ncbi:hypothetical protein QP999_00005 [Corynebacterium sp. MSK004]|uniref:hypothetical protein n=1 Tax=Corynebacterium TaxID=1716 RepID=UPI000C78E2EC|nr:MULTISPECIES: hypothetical protein [Corynebacterium]MDK8896321.1 hypothetical protein [Corynebacterium sp. MSK004]PLA39029.1 hypothetical protein CYJ46_01570 [Corynebacterium coyleae]